MTIEFTEISETFFLLVCVESVWLADTDWHCEDCENLDIRDHESDFGARRLQAVHWLVTTSDPRGFRKMILITLKVESEQINDKMNINEI